MERKHYHLLGIGGTAMGSLAGLLSAAGQGGGARRVRGAGGAVTARTAPSAFSFKEGGQPAAHLPRPANDGKPRHGYRDRG